MITEGELRDHLRADADALPVPDDLLTASLRRGRRKRLAHRMGAAAGASVLVVGAAAGGYVAANAGGEHDTLQPANGGNPGTAWPTWPLNRHFGPVDEGF